MNAPVPLKAAARARTRASGKVVWAWTALLLSVLVLSPMSTGAVLRAWASDPHSLPPQTRPMAVPHAARATESPEPAHAPAAIAQRPKPNAHAPQPWRIARAPRIARASDRLPFVRTRGPMPSRAPPA